MTNQPRDKFGKFLPPDQNTVKPPRDPGTGKFISPYEVLRRRAQNQTPSTAMAWFRKKMKELAIPDPMSSGQSFRLPIGKNNAPVMPGQLFLWNYDPKTKLKLPYYDILPLGMVVEFKPDGILALNFHYIPKIWRLRLLAKLMENAEMPMSEDDHLMLDWQTVSNVAKYPEIRACVKRYLYSHVRSRFMRINPIDWATAVMLGNEQFQKAPREKVWRDSTRKISNLRKGN